MKILWLFNHPAPYKVDFFNELGKQTDLTVLFERSSESDRSASFYHSKPASFQAIYLSSIRIGKANNFAFSIKRYLDPSIYDFIVINGWSSFTEMRVISYLKKRKIPYIFAINGGIVPSSEQSFKKRLKTKMIEGAFAYLCPDKRSESYLLHYGAKKERIHLFPYSTVFESELIKKPLSLNERKEAKESLGIEAPKVFVSVGAYIPRKNNVFLLKEIWPNVPSDYHLFLLGDGPEKKKYEGIIEEEGLRNVHLISFQKKETVLRYFALADASLFLTKEDIYGHVANESLSQGTPVIGSDASNANAHLIEDGVNGFLVKPCDKAKILSAIQDERLPLMREAALETAKSNTIEAMALDHISFFESLRKQ